MLAGQKLVRRPARMVRMSLKIRMEYQKVLRERYWEARGRREKSQILDEYCSNTGRSRKYAIRRLRAGPRSTRARERRWIYDGEVIAALAKLWEVFDYPCGQRLKPLLEAEVERLRGFGELQISKMSGREAKANKSRHHRSEAKALPGGNALSGPQGLPQKKLAATKDPGKTHRVGHLKAGVPGDRPGGPLWLLHPWGVHQHPECRGDLLRMVGRGGHDREVPAGYL